jgi:hypothetical protein
MPEFDLGNLGARCLRPNSARKLRETAEKHWAKKKAHEMNPMLQQFLAVAPDLHHLHRNYLDRGVGAEQAARRHIARLGAPRKAAADAIERSMMAQGARGGAQNTSSAQNTSGAQNASFMDNWMNRGRLL